MNFVYRRSVSATTSQGRRDQLPLFTAKAQKDGSFLSGYGLVGHGGAVFMITVEGGMKNKSAAEMAVEGMIRNIVWKRQI
jgi:hypothetical protein